LEDSLNYKLKKYANPADTIIKMCQAPHLCAPHLNLGLLISQYNNVLRPMVKKGIDERASRYQAIDTNFQDFAENRNASFFRQFYEIFWRNMIFLVRNKRAMWAIVINSTVVSMFMLGLYYHVGNPPELVAIYNDQGPDAMV